MSRKCQGEVVTMTWEGAVSAQLCSILVAAAGTIGGIPLRGVRGRAWRPEPIPAPSKEQGSQEASGQPQPWALGTSLGRTWAHGLAQICRTRDQAGQDCRGLKTGPTAALLGQELVAPGGLMCGPGPWSE